MSESLYSESWYRIAALKPRLRSHAHVHRHVYRGAVWYVLQDHSTGRFHRFTPVANLVIGLMNGERTVQAIWDLACARLGEDAPPQDDVIKLLSDLHRADVLQSDAPPDMLEQHERRGKQRRTQRKQSIGNPIAIRVPLIDPDAFTERLMPFLRPLFGWFGAVLWLAVVAWGSTLVALRWPELTYGVADHVFSVQNLLLIWLIFPLIKVLHELGHAFAVKAEGGEVHEMGVMLLVLMPIPYVDASAASAFRSKYRRMLVGAAGILVELFIAAVAMIVWTQLEPGLARAIAYNVMLITGASTLLFNGNPLLRYDGYYILSDWLEIPNLAQRANEYIGYLLNRYVFGVEGAKSPVAASGERGWFVFYAIASFAYRMFIMVAIVLLIASQYFVVGIVLAIWAFYSMAAQPLGKKIIYLFSSPQLSRRRTRALAAMTAIVTAGVLLLAAVPAPSSTLAQGVVWAPEHAQVRAGADGVVSELLSRPGQRARAGDVLVRLEDPELHAKLRVLEAQLAELEARYSAAIVTNRVQGDMIQEQIAQARAEYDAARNRLAELEVRSPSAGVLTVENAANLTGRFVQRGELLAWVLEPGASRVRVVVPQSDADRVRKETLRVEVRAAGRVGQVAEARVEREVPGATDELPSMTLSLQGGGLIGLDPARANERRTLETLFLFDLVLPPGLDLDRLGNRIYVKFVHEPQPLAEQWYRAARQLVLRQFNV